MFSARLSFLLSVLLLAGGRFAPTGLAQSGTPNPNGRVQQNLSEPEQEEVSLFQRLKAKWVNRKKTEKTESPAQQDAPSWNSNSVIAVKEAPKRPVVIPEVIASAARPAEIAVPTAQPNPNGTVVTAPMPPEFTIPVHSQGQRDSRQLPDLPPLGEMLLLPQQEFVQYDPFHGETPLLPEKKSSSVYSYSFDNRDWVEAFPAEQHLEKTNLRVAAQVVAPLGTQTVQKTASPADEWSSQAVEITHTAVVTPSPKTVDPFAKELPPEGIKIANIPKIEQKLDAARTSAKPEQPRFDALPSYANQLEFTEVCGVVVIQANFPLTEIKSMIEEIRLLQRDLSRYIGVPAAKEKIDLCLFKNERTYKQFLTNEFPNAPQDRRAMFIKLDKKPGTLLVQKSESFEIDLRHEMTHAIIHSSIKFVPIWLDEGLAKYFEVPIHERATENPYMKQVKWYSRFGLVPSLTRLEKLRDISEMGMKEYRESWSWVHFLIHHSPYTHRLLAGYLQVLRQASSNPKNWKKDGTVDVPTLESYLYETVENPRQEYREHYQ